MPERGLSEDRLKILAYVDGSPEAQMAVGQGGELAARLGADLVVMRVRAATHAMEAPPPLGRELPLRADNELPVGIADLMSAAVALQQIGYLAPEQQVVIRDISQGYIFAARTVGGVRVVFQERYGEVVEELNRAIDDKGYDLVVTGFRRLARLARLARGDRGRRLIFGLHTSLLVVRGGTLDGRFLVCIDESPASRRIYPLLRRLLPAIGPRVDLLWVREPGMAVPERVRQFLAQARDWLDGCGKKGKIIERETKEIRRAVIDEAGDDSVIVMGASLRHDILRALTGTLPQQVLATTNSSLLVVKAPPVTDIDFFKDPWACD